MKTASHISPSWLYRCFCACAGFILVSSDYTINLIGLYPLMHKSVAYARLFIAPSYLFIAPGYLRKSFLFICLVLVLSLIP
ncbi:hypothetical protein [Paraflavitalea sp. CAU 1676]|uniref:hypothetical protein n=1 Tax=Paraflavitalea sp. CAU 1676 TaxID=3032598 RepID=UPI0023DBDF5D|nr:hypothetical protein [Paraflavitalea sp. CAU 1676]MDF2193443.1 hypothetical protein [Paraflavitalea sp. CAU 1676]